MLSKLLLFGTAELYKFYTSMPEKRGKEGGIEALPFPVRTSAPNVDGKMSKKYVAICLSRFRGN